MKTIKNLPILVVLIALVASSVNLSQAAEPPEPSPEQKRLHVLAGEWNYEGEGKETPFGPAGKFRGTETLKPVLNGMFMESHWKDKTDDGFTAEGIALLGYDPLKKKYVDYGFDMDGIASSSEGKFKGNVSTHHGTRADTKGKVYKTRFIRTLSEDGKTVIAKAEYSEDGQTWMLWWELKSTKVSR